MAGILEQYYRNETGGINLYLDRVYHIYNMHDIHRVRVAIKKIKAVHRLLGSSFPGWEDVKILNSRYKRIFKSLGRYREINNTIRLLRKIGGSRKLRRTFSESQTELLQKLESDIDTSIEKFRKGKDGDLLEKVCSQLSNITHKEEISFMFSFIQEQKKGAMNLFESNPDDNELHAIRIKLKNIKPFLKLMYPEADGVFDRRDYRLLNKTESLIGDWHDLHILRKSLESLMPYKTDISVERSCRRIVDRVIKKEERNLPGIIKLTDKCLLSLDREVDQGTA